MSHHFEQPESLLPSTTTCTTGTGPCILDGDPSGMAKAALYKIEMGQDWEIGFVQKSAPIGFMPSLARAPLISSNGLREVVNWSAGVKEVHFSETVPDWLVKESQKPVPIISPPPNSSSTVTIRAIEHPVGDGSISHPV